MELLHISQLELLYKKVYKVTNLREYGFGDEMIDFIGQMTLGEVILRTKNLTTHIGMRNVGDKTFQYLREAIKESKEYQALEINHN